MYKVKLGTILENAARLAGRQVSLMSIPEDWLTLAAFSLQDGIRRIAAEKFPMMQRIEYRRYRPTWQSNSGWVKGQECWYNNDYWQLESDWSGGAPDMPNSGWKRLAMDRLVAFIAYDQPWENTIIDRASVDKSRFAYIADPKLNPDATPIKVAGFNELGVTLQSPAPKGVFVKFVPVFPRISFIEWSASKSYEAGDTVYLSSTKDCYQALSDRVPNGSSPADDPDNWQPIRISQDFECFLTKLISVDFMTEDQGKYQTKASVGHEFEMLCERYHEGVGETRIRTGRFIR